MERVLTAGVCAVALVAAFGCGVWLSPVVRVNLFEKQRKRNEGDRERVAESQAGKMLEDEQLSRGAQFLGEEGQRKLEEAFVIVVGVGGVGSHCAHLLARSGVKRLRVIDFDNVSLSSLNRHALAGREDVGTPKTVALASHINRFAPFCQVECRTQMFTAEHAEELLEGNPDYVVDCIDDRNTKVALLAYCCIKGIRLLSSMGAGAKSDPTRIQIAEFREVIKDPLASRLRWNLKQYLRNSSNPQVDFESIEVIYSSEKPTIKLLPLDAEVAGEDPSELGAVANFRVRVMPVLGTMPSMFGIAMAARVITNIAEHPFTPAPFQSMKLETAHKYNQKMRTRFDKLAKLCESQGVQAEWDSDRVSVEDIVIVFQQFAQRCPITDIRMGSGSGTQFALARWRFDKPLLASNIIVSAGKGTDAMDALLSSGRLPTPRDLGITVHQFRRIVRTLDEMRSQFEHDGEEEQDVAFLQGVDRAVRHMNADHASDCLTLVRIYGEMADAATVELVALDRFEMLFRCKDTKGETGKVARVLFPSRIRDTKDLRDTIVKLTKQARGLDMQSA